MIHRDRNGEPYKIDVGSVRPLPMSNDAHDVVGHLVLRTRDLADVVNFLLDQNFEMRKKIASLEGHPSNSPFYDPNERR